MTSMVEKRTEFVTRHSLMRAQDEACVLWALASAQYPMNAEHIREVAAVRVVEALSAFALNARRAMEVLPVPRRIELRQPRWLWRTAESGEVVKDLRDALNRIVHAQVLLAGFERLPEHLCVIDGGAVVIPYVQAKTDRRELAYIDVFAVAHAFFTDVASAFTRSINETDTDTTH